MRISDWSSDVCSSDLVEAGEELQRPQRGLAAQAQAGAVAVAEEQALVFAQRILDLAVARQRGVVVDAPAGGGLELGLLVEIGRASCRERVGQYVALSVRAFYLNTPDNTHMIHL